MKKTILTALVTAAISVTAAQAADLGKMVTKAPPPPPSPWDVAFGAAIMSDYNFRGISQSDRGPAVSAYFEPRYNFNANWQGYIGISGSSVKLATDPTAEIDFYGGIRPTFGPVAFDFGAIYYYYPKETQFCGIAGVCGGNPAFPNTNTTLADTDYWEVYGKALWTINPMFAVGANVYYAPDWLNTGADGTYASVTGKFTGPNPIFSNVGYYVSGEFGHYWFGRTDAVPGVFIANDGVSGWDLPDYNYWNVGGGFTWKTFTLDLRYHDTDLSKEECNALTADPGAAGPTAGTIVNNFTSFAASKWCGSAFIAKLSVDLTLDSLK